MPPPNRASKSTLDDASKLYCNGSSILFSLTTNGRATGAILSNAIILAFITVCLLSASIAVNVKLFSPRAAPLY
jgi:predicted aconitase with swiveling domain